MKSEWCDFCHHYVDDDVEITSEGKYICHECIEEYDYIKCPKCGVYTTHDDVVKVYDKEEFFTGDYIESLICSHCFEGTIDYFKCRECGRWINRSLVSHVLYLDDCTEVDGLCKECVSKIERPNLYTNICSYPFYGSGRKYYSSIPPEDNDPDIDENGVLRFGIEIELDEGGMNTFYAQILLEQLGMDFALCDVDPSLEAGLEFSTFPLTWKQYKERYENRLISFLSIAKKIGYDTPETTGLHVHVSKAFVKAEDIVKLELFLWKFFYKYKKELIEISGRECESEYALFPISEDPEYESRYRAVNLVSSQDTIEFRFFGGTMLPIMINARIDFCLSLIRYAKRNDFNLLLIDNLSFDNILDSMGMESASWNLIKAYLRLKREEEEDIQSYLNTPSSPSTSTKVSLFQRIIKVIRNIFSR